ncbi:hypothetical protein ACIRQF_31660 [Streptomyces sp. NPDC101191]|uniref:hypothetical protein n=1 Tax=Streptomyces sp. NPDC101191 TaxID=3366126 RepID=UPI00381C8842
MPRARFTDPELQAVYALLAPTDTGAPTATAEDIAAREGLDLAADLAAVRRRTARADASRRRSEDGGRRRENRREREDYAFEVLSRRAGHLRRSELRALAQAWTRVGLWPTEMEAWIGAVGVNGAAIARACRTAGIAVSAMDIVLDGMRVKQRLRGGEPVFSVLARATACGRSLSD